MLETNESFEEPEDLKEVDEPADDIASESADFTDLALEKENPATPIRNVNGKSQAARKMLEEYREDRALRKAIYDDLYGFDEEE